MSLWKRLLSWLRGLFFGRTSLVASDVEPGRSRSSEPARWVPRDDAGNPFGVEILDLMRLLSVVATTRDEEVAACAVSWRAGEHGRIEPLDGAAFEPCDLRYPAADELPDGIVYAPPSMDFKWVVAWLRGELRVARSWTGQTHAVARGELRDGTLVLSGVTFAEQSAFGAFSGDPIGDFDWVIRTHVFDQRIPMVVDDGGARMLEASPLSGFGPWGHALFCAAREFEPTPLTTRLCSSGDVVAAVSSRDVERLRALLSSGHSPSAPSHWTFRPLQIAAQLGDRAIVEVLLEHGARIDQHSLLGTSVLHAAIAHGADPSFLAFLVDRGAIVNARDERGFAPIHDAIAHGSPPVLEWLVGQGADIHGQTIEGFAPVHVAAALGNVWALEVLTSAGADLAARSRQGTPLEIAAQEGQVEATKWLRTRG